MSLLQPMPCQFCTFSVEMATSMPVFLVEPTFCSVDVKPELTGSACFSRRSCVFARYPSMLPEMRLLNSAYSRPTSV